MTEMIGLDDLNNHVNQLLPRFCPQLVHITDLKFLKFDAWLNESLKYRIVKGATYFFEII